MGMIKGRTITLISRTKVGENPFGEPLYEETTDQVHNVLIEPISASDLNTVERLNGRHPVITLHIPKGDAHDWIGCVVILGGEFGTRKYKQFGDEQIYQQEYCPLDWNKKVTVEIYE